MTTMEIKPVDDQKAGGNLSGNPPSDKAVRAHIKSQKPDIFTKKSPHIRILKNRTSEFMISGTTFTPGKIKNDVFLPIGAHFR